MRQTFYYNGTIITMEGSGMQTVEAVLVEDGIIWAAGEAQMLKRDLHASAVYYDLKGAVMLPGLIDTGGGRSWAKESGTRSQLRAFSQSVKEATASGFTTIQYQSVSERELMIMRTASLFGQLPIDIVCQLSESTCKKYLPVQHLFRDRYFMHIRGCRAQEDGEMPGEKADTLEEQLRLYTIRHAQQIHEDEHKGSIRAGKEADFVIADEKLLRQKSVQKHSFSIKNWVRATIQQDRMVYHISK